MAELTSATRQEVGKPKAADVVSAADRSSGEGPETLPALAADCLVASAAAANSSGRAASAPLATWQVLSMQRSAGNQAVAGLVRHQLQRKVGAPAAAATVKGPAVDPATSSSTAVTLEKAAPAAPDPASRSSAAVAVEGSPALATAEAPAVQREPSAPERATPPQSTSAAPALIRRSVVQRSITDSILESVAEHASNIPGYPLLTLVLGKDPISGAVVARTAMNVAHGILSVVPGGSKLFENLQQSGALERFFDWASGEFSKLGLSFDSITRLFKQAWDALSVTDLLEPLDAWNKVKNIFGPPLGRIKDFAIDAGKKVLEFIVEGVLKLAGPFGEQVMGMLKKGGDVFNKIVQDPIGFLGSLLAAVKGGFEGFMSHILEHLKDGLMGWLFGALAGAGLTLPQSFDLKGILSIVLQVLGLTYQNLRGKLVAAVGEKTVGYIEKAVTFVKTLVTDGLAGAWKMITEWVGNLWDMVIGAIQDWVVASIVKTAVTKLLTMFNPVGAIVQGIITIYNTISFFIERAQQIAAVASSIFDSVGRIAAGDVSGAAAFVEQTMAKAVPVVISFLANLLGLGGIADTIRGIIAKIQAPINAALDKVVGFITSKAKALGNKIKGLFGKGDKPAGQDERTAQEKDRDERAAVAAAQKTVSGPDAGEEALRKAFPSLITQYRLTTMDLLPVGDDQVKVHAEIARAVDSDPFLIVPDIQKLLEPAHPMVRAALLASIGAAKANREKALELHRILRKGGFIRPQKTIAVTGKSASLSGWNSLDDTTKQKVAKLASTELRVNLRQDAYEVQEFYEKNAERLAKLGYIPRGHVFDPEDDPGLRSLSHAEKQEAVAGSCEIGVSKSVCEDDCAPFLFALAQLETRNIVVCDPDGTWIFYATGTSRFMSDPSRKKG